MSGYALVFPGQGAQEVGMGRDFYEAYPAARRVFEEANRALDFDLTKVIFEGPEEELKKTAITQPAILTVSVAILSAAREDAGIPLEPMFVAGHSLGEYTALAAAGAISVADAVRLVHLRGSRMQDAVPLGVGAMAAVMGLEGEAIREICQRASTKGVCEMANYNAPGQIVISGEAPAVEAAAEMLKEAGASKVIPLKVSAPFHCSLMRPVADHLREAFTSVRWGELSCPLVSNVDAKPRRDMGEIRERLLEQTYSPVLWLDSMRAMADSGVDAFIEFGPGNVLTGLAKRCVKGKRAKSVSKVSDLEGLLDFIKGGN
ncbi:ACP S-malonyltransferase [Thermanaerovibrio acidaminovorans]|jgi:[acyl-carrier-protein] S-malonyltransferase|uniref:Malonyl CoA-acyl carrier protein transacylase n=1 Tax=Thermanaerovibrio acidaminovorans (strain ATCC 49978 / DSM 6589 / Su883) TaxID=525903 RepID=D1B5N9_THEAS|nr:ACP S-malonyltransferase [Thermanaerovibrio acidaminovorans]ACZ19330.1 malonyl CoA-acyl carrier protein transacylase [Thermanaerovibrio acidaminovorans DSM 6589]